MPAIVIESSADVILLVEDDAFLRGTIAGSLRTDGFHVIEAGDAATALEQIRLNDGAIDWLITDYQLGEISGIHVAFEFRFLNPMRPIVFVTAMSEPADIKRMSGVIYLQKPFTPEKLLSVMSSLRAQKDQHPPLEALAGSPQR